MFRHPRYLEIPWDVHWDKKDSGHHHLLLMLILIFIAMFFIGVGITSGLVENPTPQLR